jgi:MFS family permease
MSSEQKTLAIPETSCSVTVPAMAAAARASSRAGTLTALFLIGFGAFLPLHAPQPLLPQFRHLFGASELMVSLTISAPVLAVALAAPLVGLLADAVGRKRVIVVAMLGLTFPTALAGTSANLAILIAWRFVQGLFIPGIVATAMAYINEESPDESAGSTMAIYVTGTVVGGFAGRFLVGVAENHWGWRIAFLVLGAATLAATVAVWRLLPRATKFIRQSTAAAVFGLMRAHLRNPQLLATYAVGFNVLFCMVGTFTYVNFYLADKPFFLGPAALGSIFGVFLIGAVITPVAGHILDRIGHRRTLLGAVGISVAGMLLTMIQNVPTVIAGLTLESLGVFVCQSASASYVGRAAAGGLSSAAGIYVAFYYLGGCMGSILPGFIWKQAGWFGCVTVIIFMQFVALLIAGKLWRD